MLTISLNILSTASTFRRHVQPVTLHALLTTHWHLSHCYAQISTSFDTISELRFSKYSPFILVSAMRHPSCTRPVTTYSFQYAESDKLNSWIYDYGILCSVTSTHPRANHIPLCKSSLPPASCWTAIFRSGALCGNICFLCGSCRFCASYSCW